MGFEPTLEFPLNTLSKRAPSATRPSLQRGEALFKLTHFNGRNGPRRNGEGGWFSSSSDLLGGTTFYNAQCGNYSSSNSGGFIAGSQLKQNVFDHEGGSVFSHWSEYRDAQNNPSNNIGTVLETTTAPPGSTGATFAQNAANAAAQRIGQAVSNEPCGGYVNNDSSQGCATCGNINYSPYQACTGQPVPYCH